MNWTEGRLQRHSSTNRKSTAQQRQKAHFARVQQNLRSESLANKNSPVKFSVFGIDIRDRERLEQYLSPAVQNSSFNDNKARGSKDSLRTSKIPPPPASERRISLSRDRSRSRRPSPVKEDTGQVLDDDLYSASPPIRPMKRKHDAGALESVGARGKQGGNEALSEIKRRLLRKGDWVGITRQKPLKLVYGSIKDGNDIGRRRKVSEEHRARYRSAQSHIESPFPARNRAHHYDYLQHTERSQPLAPDVRIRIGDRTVPPGVSSSTGRRQGPSTSGKRSSRALSSEVLLLDSESSRGVFDDGYTRSRREKSCRQDSLLLASSRATSRRRFDESSKHSKSLLALSSHDDLCDSGGVLEQDQGWAGVTADSLAKLQQNFQTRCDPGDKSSSRSRKPSGSQVDLYGNMRLGKEIFSSSSAPMYHPKPRTSKKSLLLQEDSSQIAESNLAQLGKPESRLSSSQQLQEEIWRSWVAPESDVEKVDGQSPEDPLGIGWISPGPSMIPPERPPTRFLPCEDEYSSELEAPDDSDQYINMPLDDGSTHSSAGEAASLRPVDRQDEDLYCAVEPPAVVTSSQEVVASMDHRTSTNTEENPTDAKESQLPTQDTVNPAQVLAKSALHADWLSEADPDDVWRKFVFGSSDDIQSPDRSAAEDSNAFTKVCDHSSIIAHPSSGQQIGDDSHSRSLDQLVPSPQSHLTEDSRRHVFDQANSAISSPAGDGRTSMFASDGSVPSLDRFASTPRALPAGSSSNLSYNDNGYSKAHQQKIVFTKPKPFIGRESRVDATGDYEPVHIGKRLINEAKEHEAESKSMKKRYKHVSHFADDEQDELESIEDD